MTKAFRPVMCTTGSGVAASCWTPGTRGPPSSCCGGRRAADAEPGSTAIRESLARAQFDAGSYPAALENFREVAGADPANDYAQFGWGLAAARTGDFVESAVHLALAVAMRPDIAHYKAALKQTRATLKARAGGFGTPGAVGQDGRDQQDE